MYVIPKRLAKKAELFEGIGLKEVGIFGLFALFGFAGFLIVAMLGFNLIYRVGIFAVISMIGFALIYPLQYKENIIVLGKRYLIFSKQQNLFFFYRGTGGFSPKWLYRK